MRRLLKQEVEEYVDKLREKVVQEDNKTIIGGNLEVDGSISGNEIVEKMSGYAFIPDTNLASNCITLNYVGIVKNGNKLTLAIAGVFNHTTGATIDSNPNIGRFTLPQAVKDKLYPNSLGNFENKSILFLNSSTEGISKYTRLTSNFLVQFFKLNEGFKLDTDYGFRYEATFLLSSNLVE